MKKDKVMVKSLKEKMLERRITRLESLVKSDTKENQRRLKNEESFADIERRNNIRQLLDVRYGYDKIIELFNSGAGDTRQLRKIVEGIVDCLTENDLWDQAVYIVRDVLTHNQLVDVLANMVFSKKLLGNHLFDINNEIASNLTTDQINDIIAKNSKGR